MARRKSWQAFWPNSLQRGVLSQSKFVRGDGLSHETCSLTLRNKWRNKLITRSHDLQGGNSTCIAMYPAMALPLRISGSSWLAMEFSNKNSASRWRLYQTLFEVGAQRASKTGSLLLGGFLFPHSTAPPPRL